MKSEVEKLKTKIAKLEDIIDKLTAMDTSCPTHLLLSDLSKSSNLLLGRYGYDVHGWELIHHNITAATERVKTFKKILSKRCKEKRNRKYIPTTNIKETKHE